MSSPSPTARPPRHFAIVCIAAVVWNGFGLYDWLMSLQGEAYYLKNGFTAAQAHYQISMPAWMQMAWSVGVWTSVLGTVLLLSRRRQAFPVFLISLACALASLIYQDFLSDGAAILGVMILMSWAIVGACGGLAWYAWWMTKRGWLR